MASEAVESGSSAASEYIRHHLTNLTYGKFPDGHWGLAHSAEEGEFWINPAYGRAELLPLQDVYRPPGLTCGEIIATGFWNDRVPELRGTYIYGDFCSGRIWGLRHDGQGVTDEALLLDSNLMIPSFAEDQRGELLILSFDGRIYRLR